MWIVCAIAGVFLLAVPVTVSGQSTTEAPLASLVQGIFGPRGLIVNSEALLPDGSTHSAHFNSAFQSNFRQFNIALASQLTSVPLPSPSSGFTYQFDATTGTFARSTQSFGPILSDRAETIGAGRMVFGYNYQFFSFDSLEGVRLRRIPAVFSHDEFELGGGRTDVVVTNNAIKATVSQFTGLITYGLGDRLDLSAAIPVVRTTLTVVSDTVIQYFGTPPGTATHFFSDATAPGGFGSTRQFSSRGAATGVGDVVLRAKSTLFREGQRAFAAGLEVRAPSGNEEDLLGSGAWGIRPFGVVSFTYKRISPHVNLGYQWNGSSVLAGDPATGIEADLPERISLAVGADIGVNDRLTLVLDLLADRILESQRLVETTFSASGPLGSAEFPDIGFVEGSYFLTNGAVGLKVNVATGMLINFNVRFSVGSHGLTDRMSPLVGIEYGF